MCNVFDPNITYYLCKGLSPEGGVLSQGKVILDGDKLGSIVNGQLVDDGAVLGFLEGTALILVDEQGNRINIYELIPQEEFN